MASAKGGGGGAAAAAENTVAVNMFSLKTRTIPIHAKMTLDELYALCASAVEGGVQASDVRLFFDEGLDEAGGGARPVDKSAADRKKRLSALKPPVEPGTALKAWWASAAMSLEDQEFLSQRISEVFKKPLGHCLYRASQHGWGREDFEQRCAMKGPLVVVVHARPPAAAAITAANQIEAGASSGKRGGGSGGSGGGGSGSGGAKAKAAPATADEDALAAAVPLGNRKFGAFLSVNLEKDLSKGKYCASPYSFLFNLATRAVFPLKPERREKGVFFAQAGASTMLSMGGGDLCLYEDCNEHEFSFARAPQSFDTTVKAMLGQEYMYFGVRELEVFTLLSAFAVKSH